MSHAKGLFIRHGATVCYNLLYAHEKLKTKNCQFSKKIYFVY
jgi:hypothetical protein